MTVPLSVGGRVIMGVVTELQTAHRHTLLALKEILDCAANDDTKGVLTKLGELFPELDAQKTLLFELETICKDAARRGPYKKEDNL
jgi:hypothetical protein